MLPGSSVHDAVLTVLVLLVSLLPLHTQRHPATIEALCYAIVLCCVVWRPKGGMWRRIPKMQMPVFSGIFMVSEASRAMNPSANPVPGARDPKTPRCTGTLGRGVGGWGEMK